MKKRSLRLLFVGFLLILQQSFVQSQNMDLNWAHSIGSGGHDIGVSMALDDLENVFVTGYFRGMVDFDPAGPIENLTSASSAENGYLLKLNRKGEFQWVKHIGIGAMCSPFSIAIDDFDNILLFGSYAGTVDFDPGPDTFNLNAGNGVGLFILKLSSNGSFIWAKALNGVLSGYSWASFSIAANLGGDVYVASHFRNSVDFDPGPGTYNLTSNGGDDCFVLKLDTGGNFLWARSFGSSLDDDIYSLDVDDFGNVYSTGFFWNTVDFDPDTSTLNLTSNGFRDIFVQKLDNAGNLSWAEHFGSSGYDLGMGIKSDPFGSVLVTGMFTNTVDFDPSSSVVNQTAIGGGDIFIQKLNSSGGFDWVKTIGGIGGTSSRALSVDDSGFVYTTGTFNDSIDFDPGPDTFYLSSSSGTDAFILKLKDDGNFAWAGGINGSGLQRGNSITSDPLGSNIYTCGDFYSSADFDPTADTFFLSSNGNSDIFVQKLTNCEPDSTVDILQACDSIVWIDGKTYFEDNDSSFHILKNSLNCDSVITLNLNILSDETIDYVTTCSSYTWIDGKTYHKDNKTATHTLMNAAGCDSVITLNLNIATNSFKDKISACDSLTWIDGKTYYEDNDTTKIVFTNSYGCDSVIHLDLTVHKLNASASANGMKLTANVQGGLYRWLDCNNSHSFIAQATNRSFTPKKNGSYAVQIRKNGCTDTSECVTIDYVGVNENEGFGNVSIYPNPSDGLFTIDFGGLSDVSIKVYNSLEQIVYKQDNIDSDTYLFEIKGSSGIYILELDYHGNRERIQLIKN